MKEFEKIIWQTHKWDYDDLPELYKKTSKTWQLMNPDWDYRYIPNSEIRNEIEKISTDYKIVEAFDKAENILSKTDIYREAMVYEYGGLWADMDSVCLFPIDKSIKNDLDKDMICLPPVVKFGLDEDRDYRTEEIDQSINKLLSGKECGYWISNAVFLGKKHNKISEEIIKAISGTWTFKESSYMGMRSELYEKYGKDMSITLNCACHDGRLNLRSY